MRDIWGNASALSGQVNINALYTQEIPSFYAYDDFNSITSSGTYVDFDANDIEVFDVGGDHTLATGVFTAPVEGVYRFYGYGLMGAKAAGTNRQILFDLTNSSNTSILPGATNPINHAYRDTGNSRTLSFDFIIELDAGDTAKVRVQMDGVVNMVDRHIFGELIRDKS